MIYKYNELLTKDGTSNTDNERQALFWIISCNDDLYSKVNYIYDFDDRIINPDCLTNGEVDFCSSSRALVKLAFNLYNGFPADVLESFISLDEENFKVAMTAIKIRFNHVD